METKRTYHDDLKIDPDNLDVEWLNQPNIFMEYAELSARAEYEAKRAEEKVKTIRSEIILEVQQNPDLVPEGKATAQATEAYFRTKPEYKEAKRAMHEAYYNAQILANAVSAFHQRRVALENLVKLQGQGYFAGPTEPRNLGLEYGKKARHHVAADMIKNSTERRRTK